MDHKLAKDHIGLTERFISPFGFNPRPRAGDELEN